MDFWDCMCKRNGSWSGVEDFCVGMYMTGRSISCDTVAILYFLLLVLLVPIDMIQAFD